MSPEAGFKLLFKDGKRVETSVTQHQYAAKKYWFPTEKQGGPSDRTTWPGAVRFMIFVRI